MVGGGGRCFQVTVKSYKKVRVFPSKIKFMLIRMHPDNPQPRLLKQVADCLRGGGVVIYPTDTIYGLGCDIAQQKAVERICRIKGVDRKKHSFPLFVTT
jgi:tRNA A37 threonylcarbamoyladenosine synthetase subunit TsaC/SUA5/YrdC